MDDYLAAAGVDPATVSTNTDTADLTPTEVLLDSVDAADGGALPDDTPVDDSGLTSLDLDTLDQPQDDPQHHGV